MVFRPPLLQYDLILILSAETLFLSKVIFTGPGSEDLTLSFRDMTWPTTDLLINHRNRLHYLRLLESSPVRIL